MRARAPKSPVPARPLLAARSPPGSKAGIDDCAPHTHPAQPGVCPGSAVGRAHRRGGPGLPALRPPLTWPDPAGT